jgi:hypothetical protein
MEQEKQRKAKEEEERLASQKKLSTQFSDTKAQWEQDKQVVQDAETKDKAAIPLDGIVKSNAGGKPDAKVEALPVAKVETEPVVKPKPKPEELKAELPVAQHS